VGCDDYAGVLATSKAAKRDLSEVLSALEFFDSSCLDLVEQQLGYMSPLEERYNFYVLLETSGSNGEHDEEKLGAFLEGTMEEGSVVDGVIAQDASQGAAIWQLRETIAEALKKAGAVYKYDVSIPVPVLYDLVEDMRARMKHAGEVSVLGYGHLGDGNLHLNVSAPEYSAELLGRIEPFIYEWTSEQQGSISAEHGLGLMKANCIHYSKSKEAVDMMHAIKGVFDPTGIMNPYKTLPAPTLEQ